MRTTDSPCPATQTASYELEFPRRQARDRVRAQAPEGRVPRVTRLLALTHRIDGMIQSGDIRDWAEAARLAGITRARMTQIANLLLLAPDIQEAILNSSRVADGRDPIS